MFLIRVFSDIKELFKQGNALKASGFLINTEATAIAIYGLLNAIIITLHDLGFDVQIGSTDLHTMANGWAITASFAYSIYRVTTNASAGFSSGAK